jgi:hypothetical protein
VEAECLGRSDCRVFQETRKPSFPRSARPTFFPERRGSEVTRLSGPPGAILQRRTEACCPSERETRRASPRQQNGDDIIFSEHASALTTACAPQITEQEEPTLANWGAVGSSWQR